MAPWTRTLTRSPDASPGRDAARARRRDQARDPDASPDSLRRLARHARFDPVLGRALAAHPLAPPRLLARLTRSPRWDVRAGALAHPSCPARRLRNPHTLEPWASREAVARSDHAPARAQEKLATDLSPVRLALAANPATAPEVVARLLRDHDPYVRGAAATHRAASPDALLRMSDNLAGPGWMLRGIARNPSCPPERAEEILTWLALGGAPSSALQFDPVGCNGHPGDPHVSELTWYRRQAEGLNNAEWHALWRVRAQTTSARSWIPFVTLNQLARDPRVEVRVTAARFSAMSATTLRELAWDASPAVAATAQNSLQRKREAFQALPIHKRYAR